MCMDITTRNEKILLNPYPMVYPQANDEVLEVEVMIHDEVLDTKKLSLRSWESCVRRIKMHREHPKGKVLMMHGMKKGKEVEGLLIKISWPTSPFSYRIKKKVADGKFSKFIAMLKKLSVNVKLVEALEQMFGYAKFMKNLVIENKTISY